jgi:putative peptidoglycan lipid II flippase
MGIFAMAVGVLVGGMAQVLFQLPQFIRIGYRLSFRIDFSLDEFRQILKKLGSGTAHQRRFRPESVYRHPLRQ